MSDIVKFWIELASIVITVASVSVAIRAWTRTRTFVRRRQDPNKRVPDYTILNYIDVENGIRKLTREAQRLRPPPNHIVGINRGGAIVGGCLAKKLHIPTATNSFFLLHVYRPRLKEGAEEPVIPMVVEQRADNIPIKEGDTVLLVDDAVRTPSHMQIAEEYLRMTYPNITLRKYVLLCVATRLVGPEDYDTEIHLDEYAFITSGGNVFLPWDPDEDLKACEEDKKKVQK